jgi:hypothetical protein
MKSVRLNLTNLILNHLLTLHRRIQLAGRLLLAFLLLLSTASTWSQELTKKEKILQEELWSMISKTRHVREPYPHGWKATGQHGLFTEAALCMTPPDSATLITLFKNGYYGHLTELPVNANGAFDERSPLRKGLGAALIGRSIPNNTEKFTTKCTYNGQPIMACRSVLVQATFGNAKKCDPKATKIHKAWNYYGRENSASIVSISTEGLQCEIETFSHGPDITPCDFEKFKKSQQK